MKVNADNFADLLLDYVYGELAPDVCADFEAYVAEHPEAQNALAELQQTRAALEPLALDFEPPSLGTRRVLAHAQEAAERMEERGRTWLFLPRYATALAAVVAVAIGLIVVARVQSVASKRTPAAFDVASIDEATQEALAASDAEMRSEEDAVAPSAPITKQEFKSLAATPPAVSGEGNESVGLAGSSVRRRGIAEQVGARTADMTEQDALRPLAEAESPGEASAVEQTARLNRLAYQAPIVMPEPALEEARKAKVAKGATVSDESAQVDDRRYRDSTVAAVERPALAPARETLRKDQPTVSGGLADDANAFGRVAQEQSAVASTAPASSATPRLQAELDAGRAQQLAGAHSEAVGHFQNVVAWAPEQPVAAEAQYETARSFQAVGDCARAVQAYQDVLDNAPAFPKRDDALLNQAFCFERLGQYADAVARYDMYAAEFPTQQEVVQTQRDHALSNIAPANQ